MSADEKLLIAVLRQMPPVKLDYKLLAEEIGTPTPGAAQKRWQRFQNKLRSNVGSPTKPTGVTKPPMKNSIRSPPKKKNTIRYDQSDEGTIDTEEDMPVTPPPRELPKRKARVTKFKKEDTEDDEASDSDQAQSIKES